MSGPFTIVLSSKLGAVFPPQSNAPVVHPLTSNLTAGITAALKGKAFLVMDCSDARKYSPL
jgi:hypothetical protein